MQIVNVTVTQTFAVIVNGVSKKSSRLDRKVLLGFGIVWVR